MRIKIKYPNFDGTQNCAGLGVDIFFQDFNTPEGKRETVSLREFCVDCKIVNECADYGIKHERFGFWGGLTPRERDAIRKERGITVMTPEYVSDYKGV